MQQHIKNYLKEINEKFKTGQATEHTYRSALQILLETLNPNIIAINESKRRSVGMPDFTIKDKKKQLIEIGGIEAKDLYIDLEHKKNSDQLDRYLTVFDNFIYTNNLEFVFYRNKKKVKTITLGNCDKKHISWKQGDELYKAIDELEASLKDFLQYEGEKITSPSRLAKAMAKKAQQIKYAINKILKDEKERANLFGQYQTFKELLVHDLTEEQFADMYAQTVAYGLFSARLYDPTLENFSRQEAERLIPKSTPFIRRLFKQISNDDEFDNRIAYIIDDLINIFLLCNVAEILHNYGKSTQMQDPIIHFYETFLGEYDANMRKKRGVYYTPQPVVKFIVKGIDTILKTEFDLSMGLADTSKIEAEFKDHSQIEQDKRFKDGQRKIKKTVHRVQVLDPATGTGTFLNETIKYIHETYFQGQTGMWSNYIEKDLLPRIWGFEILMASYTMAHLKLGLTLSETGWNSDERINIYLTNSLEEPHDTMQTLFSQQLARESQQASKVKKEQPIMIVMGNPPYAVSSSNKGEWIQGLISDYKKDLNERKINLDDDYIKFIRYAQHFIDKNNEGIIGMITNNSYIDGITHRQMRKELMKSFDKIYVYDLHGNSKKKETTLDGSKDENVFDIMQGVSIIFAVKKGPHQEKVPHPNPLLQGEGTKSKKRKSLAEIYHYDSYGKRDVKYNNLNNNDISTIQRTKLNPVEPYYFFVPKNFEAQEKYDEGVMVDELFEVNGSGINTDRDNLFIDFDKDKLENRIKKLLSDNISENSFISEYNIRNSGSYKIIDKIKNQKFDIKNIKKCGYRPFDNRFMYYDNKIISRPGYKIMKNFNKENIMFLTSRSFSKTGGFDKIFISKNIIERHIANDQTYCFPLYLYNENGTEKKPNFNDEIIAQIEDKLGMRFTHLNPHFKGGLAKSIEKAPSQGVGGNKTPKIEFTAEDIRKRGLIRDGKGFPYNPNNVEKAKKLRKNQTPAEEKLWNEFLKQNKPKRYRQRPIDHFIADFYCAKKSLIIEIDGGIHDNENSKGYDKMRTELLELYGLKVIRFRNEEIFNNFENVCKQIDNFPIITHLNPPCKGGLAKSIEKAPSQGVGGNSEIKGNFTPENLFDYIYAVLHSPTYRKKYKEFLKIDFPRIPITDNKEIFWQLVGKGGELRQFHLMEHPDSQKIITEYPETGDNVVEKIKFQDGKVFINKTQYFNNVPEIARNFYIGGYQPAQKWLKDRKGRELSFEDILHWQKIIVALVNTEKVMKEIDRIKFI